MDRAPSFLRIDPLKDQHLPDSTAIKYYTETDIGSLLDKLSIKTAFLKEETDLFRRYADRITQGKGFKTKERDNAGMAENPLEMLQELLVLTTEQKGDIASHEADERRQELSQVEKAAKRQADKYECKMKECDQFKEFVEYQNKDFEHKIISKNASAERFIKWLEDTARRLELMYRSENLANQSNYAQIRALRATLHKQEELGENLTQVDFMKVEIENRLLVQTSDKLKSDIQTTNKENNKTSLALAELTQRSIDLNRYIQEGQEKLKSNAEILRRIEKEMGETVEMARKLDDWNSVANGRNARCPSIAVYIQIEKDIELLQQLRKEAMRKVQIIQMAKQLKSKKSRGPSLEEELQWTRPAMVHLPSQPEPYEIPAIVGSRSMLHSTADYAASSKYRVKIL
ncbi:protein Daple-like isoform X2 [Paramacrobiotus metropolitanus]|uniref:protein Daple-like isoform X2 n=1 Tax=Paramacrobiotus metropolitanus TaxID=2943436 RepID=UPI002445CEF0|nr:protein Daple-like isoform X2 [Paramacrobiotus metropolitanus]